MCAHECPITVCMCKLRCSGNYCVSTVKNRLHLEIEVSKSRHKEERKIEEKRFNLLNAYKGSHLLTDNTIIDKNYNENGGIECSSLKFSFLFYSILMLFKSIS